MEDCCGVSSGISVSDTAEEEFEDIEEVPLKVGESEMQLVLGGLFSELNCKTFLLVKHGCVPTNVEPLKRADLSLKRRKAVPPPELPGSS